MLVRLHGDVIFFCSVASGDLLCRLYTELHVVLMLFPLQKVKTLMRTYNSSCYRLRTNVSMHKKKEGKRKKYFMFILLIHCFVTHSHKNTVEKNSKDIIGVHIINISIC